MVTCRTFSKPTLILLSVLKQNSLFSPNLPNLTNSPNFPNSHAIQFQWFSTFLSCGTFKGSFFAAHFNTKNNFCCTPTLYIVGQIWWETYYSSQFYNLAAHLKVTCGTLLCPGTVFESHWLNHLQ